MADQDYIIAPLREHAVPVGSLKIDPANANTHPERNMRAIVESLDEFGQRQVLVAREDSRTVIAGNGRLEAARQLGWSHVACVFVDDDELQAMRYAIADNRSGELSEWDGDVLTRTLDAIKQEQGDLEGTGWTDEELGDMVNGLTEPEDGEWGDAFGAIPDEDRDPITSWRFILHDDQKETVEGAIRQAKECLDVDDPRNENGNGNALYAICTDWMGMR